MKKLLLLILLPTIAIAQIPSGYYDQANGLSGYTLKTKLHEIISQKVYAYNYSDVIGFYADTDLDHFYENDGSVLDIYSENPTGPDAYNYNLSQNISSASAEGQGWNREHGMPQSTFYGIYPMYSDLHYLIPGDAYINQRRSNYPYARNNGSSYNFTNGSKLGKSTTPGYTNTVYEPIDEFKGDVARYLLYFVVRYEGSLEKFNHMLATCPLDGTEEKGFEDWYITMLKEWNTLDPVSPREIARNNAIYSIENVRNPFIDHPEYVDLIWDGTTETSTPNSPIATATEIGESYAKLQWDISTSPNVLGYQVFQDGNYIGYTHSNTFFADRLTTSTAYQFTIKAYNSGYHFSAPSNAVAVTTQSADSFAKDLMITKYIEGNTNNTAIEITNKTNHPVVLENYYLSIQFKGANDTYYFSDNYQLQGSILPGESKVVVNSKSNFTNYPKQNADYITNATPMTFTGSQYIELAYGNKVIKTVSTNNYDMNYTTVDAVGIKNTSNTNNNKSLYRNANVADPNINFTLSEWTQYPSNYTDGLGDDLLKVDDTRYANNIILYPNPVTDGIIYLKTDQVKQIKQIQIFDISGKKIRDIQSSEYNRNGIDVHTLSAGIYLLNVDGKVLKFIKK